MRPSKERLLEVVTYVEPGSDDVTFTHAVFAQCFLPIRKLPKSQKLYEVRHGRAALAVLAGALLEPASKRFVAMDIPSGSAARVALAHINNHIIRSRRSRGRTDGREPPRLHGLSRGQHLRHERQGAVAADP
jgi:hypothetical protein